MINYIEKGFGLHEAIRAAGHWLREEDGAWVSSNDEAVQAIIDGYTDAEALAHEKATKSSESIAMAKRLRDKVVAPISAGEMASWSIKAAEASKFAATGDASLCPMLSMEASARGITVPQLVSKVNGNSQRFMAAETAIGGADGKHRDAIAAMTTIEQVQAYDVSLGWPVI